MPHTWIVWVYAQIVHSHIATQEMSAIRSPSLMKTSTFSIQDCENTFYMSVLRQLNRLTLQIYAFFCFFLLYKKELFEFCIIPIKVKKP